MFSKRVSPKTPSYRLHKASGQGIVTLNGRDFYLGKYRSAASREEYDRVVSEWLASGRSIQASGKSNELAVAELLSAYWKHAKSYYTRDGVPTSELACIRQAMRPLKESYGRSLADQFGPLSLKAVPCVANQANVSVGY
jgi:hypothetical protein